jgi:hypothetical protein
MARHKDVDWNLPQGTPHHSWESINAALLMDLRDELKASNQIARETKNSIDSIRHFFHALGQERLKLLVREKHRELDLRAKRRRRRLAAARRRLREQEGR